MLRNRDVKVQEAALYALTALAKTKVTSATIPQDGVRQMARIRVYNMAYLNPIHAFGPFLRVDAYHPRSSSTTKDRKLSSGAAGGGQGEEEVTPDVLGSPSSNASQPVPPIPDANDYLSPLTHADDGSDIDDVDFVPEDGGDSDDDNDERDRDANVSSSEFYEGRSNGVSTSNRSRVDRGTRKRCRVSNWDNHEVAVHLAKAPAGRSTTGAHFSVTVFLWSPDSVIMPEFPITLPLALGLCKLRMCTSLLVYGKEKSRSQAPV
jgi:hypothetical protein